MSWLKALTGKVHPLPLLIAAAGVLLSVGGAERLQHKVDLDAQATFDRAVVRLESEVQRRFALPMYGLRGARGVWAASPTVGRAEFAAYVASRDLALEFPGVRGFGFVEPVARAALPAFVQARRAEGASGYTPSEAGPLRRDDLWLVKYIEPAAANAGALGLDAGSESRRREAIERAVRSGQPALSAPVRLLQDRGGGAGFLLFLPVYRGGAPLDSEAQRAAALSGLLYVPLVAQELLAGAADAAREPVDFALAHGGAGAAAEAVFGVGGLAAAVPARSGARFDLTRTLQVAGSPFTLRVASNPAFEAAFDRGTPLLALGGGSLLTLLLACLAHLTAAGRERAEAAARRLTAELDRLATVARRTSNAVVITDAQRRITWVNEGFERISGFTQAESLGRSPGALLQGPMTDAAEVARLRGALDRREAYRGELLNVAKDGRGYWVELEIQPLQDAEGRPTGFMAIESDVTERRRIAVERAEEQARMALILAGTHAGTWDHDELTGIDRINARYAEMLGFTVAQAQALMASSFTDLVHPEDVERVRQARADHLAGRSAELDCEYRMRHADGHWIWVHSRGRVGARDASGRPLRTAGIQLDVSERKRAERALAHERRRLNNIIEGTDAGTWEWNVETGELHVNARWADICGHTLASLGVRSFDSWVALCHPEDLARSTALMQRHFRGETPNYECEARMRHRDGHWVWVLARGKLFSRSADGRPRWIAGTNLDITPRKLAELALHASTERFRLAADSAGIGVWELDPQADAVKWDDWMARLYGVPRCEGWQPAWLWRQCLHDGDRPRVLDALQSALQGGAPFAAEFRIVRPDGELRQLRAEAQRLGDGEGRVMRMVGVMTDITERRRAEDELRASRAFLDRAGRIAGVGGWALDLQTHELQWSDETCRIHGVPPGHRPTLPQALGCYLDEARPLIESALQEAITSGSGWDLELPFLTLDGRAIWVRTMGELVFEDGQARRLVGAFQDVTARRALEDALRQKNEVMESILENLPCGLSVFDAELRLVAANTAFRRLLDLPDALFEAPGVPFERFVRHSAERGEYGGGDVEATVRQIAERARSQPVAHRFERLRHDGTPLEVCGAPLPGGGFVTTYTDLTARKQAEAEVERAHAILRASIEALDDAFALFDPDDRLVLCNERYRSIYPEAAPAMVTGNSFEQIVRHGAERGLYGAAAADVDAWVVERMALHRQPHSQLVQKLGDGRTLRIIERRMDDGHTVGFRIDITDFVRATEAAQAASTAKSQFLANMSHEIRTPMNAILGMLALLRRTEMTTRQADYAAKSEDAARSLLGLLNDILDFSKVEAGKMTLDPQPFRIDQLLRNLSVILSSNGAGKPVELLFDIDPALPRWLVGDAMRLQQVLINLSGNALKFTPQGEVVVAVAVRRRTAHEVRLAFEVRDTGIGIAPENHARIFSGFTQAEASTTRRFGGTGLGLAICQRMVGMMGGELALDSALGRGSRFHFELTLPLGDGADAPDLPQAPAPARSAAAAALRVLVVDDHAAAREVLARLAGSLGWQAELADGGVPALELLRARPGGYDAVLVDWQMPGLDGWQTCERIHADSLAGDAPVVIMVTGHGRELLAQRCIGQPQGPDGFLVKPVTASMLHDAVADARAGRLQARVPAGVVPAQARLAGLRLLLVEDNQNNQQVALELLEGEGAQVQLASDGLQAVAAVAAERPPFDAVLMDLQMPVMDGYAATSRIRQDLGQLALPIVAMTANAMASDREACLAAGMNEHVGKPFDLDHLVKVLQRLCARADAAAAPAGPAAPAVALPPALADAAAAAGVEARAALARLGGQLGVYSRLLRNFVHDLEGLQCTLREQAQHGDAEGAMPVLHTLKGLAATLGARALADHAAHAEQALRGASDGAAAAVVLAPMDAAIGQARAALAGWQAALEAGIAAAAAGAPPRAPAERAAMAETLHELARLLEESDMDALPVLERLRAAHARSLGPRFAALDEAVGRLDFEAALTMCRGLLKEHVA